MVAVYPGALPVRATAGANLSTNPHSALHNNMYDEIVAIATVLGTSPADAHASVKARIQAAERLAIPRFANAAARNTATSGYLTEGLFAYLIDTNTLTVYTAAAWSTIGPVHGQWTDWTPNLAQTGFVTVTVNYARYQRIGRTIQGSCRLTCTGSGTAPATIAVANLPAAAAATGIAVGSGYISDLSTPGNSRQGQAQMFSTTQIGVLGDQHLYMGNTSSGFVQSLASGDVIHLSFAYEAAADG